LTYGKTLGGVDRIGVGSRYHSLMKRYKQRQPANVSLARGTF